MTVPLHVNLNYGVHMKTQPIRLDAGNPNRQFTIHSVALATFKFLRKTGHKAAGLPSVLQSCARDITTAWAESRPKA